MNARSVALLAFAMPLVLGPLAGAQTEALPSLPPPDASTSTPTPAPTPTPPATPTSAPTPTPTPTPPAIATPTPTLIATPAPTPGFYRLAFQTESAVGTPGPFFNQLLGIRFDRCFTWNTCLGAYVGYANLKGQSGRANDGLGYVMVEHRLSLSRTWYLPLRLATGYLPMNGPYTRVSAGLGATSGKLDFVFELLAPTLWVSGNEPVLSMDFAAEVAVHW
jgi:hypothetical protein